MRNVFYILAATLLLVSCGEKSESPGSKKVNTIPVSVTLYLPETGQARWTRKDCASLFTETEQCAERFESSDKGSSVIFNGSKTDGDVLLYALSPYDPDATISEGIIRGRFADRQHGGIHTPLAFGSGNEEEGFGMKCTGALLKLSVHSNSGITSLTLSGTSFLSGRVKLDCNSGNMSLVESSALNSVTLAGVDPVNEGTYYLSVLPNSSATALSVSYNGSGKDSETVDCPSGFPAGTITDLGTFSLLSSYHPSLLLLRGEEAKIRERIAANPSVALLHSKIIAQADKAITKVPSRYVVQDGDAGLLYVSRYTLSYLFPLSYAYRMTGESKYLSAAVTELNAVCSFPDWHPSHYLDTGEMCAAVAIAYDWLYDYLPTRTRKLVEEAIEANTLDTYDKTAYNNKWYQKNNNQNQVNAAGIYLGATALKPVCPDKASNAITKVLASVKIAIDGYDPDGAYPEGTGYWSYGTSFNSLLNFAVESVGDTPYYGKGGFDKTARYFLFMKGPSGDVYNYSDGSSECDVEVAPFYFAQKEKNSDLIWWELQAVSKDFTQTNRLLTSAIVFLKDLDVQEVLPPSSLTWYGNGTTPVYSTRTSWSDPNASWLAIKGGLANSSHSHMDGGSFIFEALGERWVIDLGGESYTNLTTNGINQGNLAQDSQRWDVLKYCASSHSVIRLDDARLLVNGKATIASVINESGRQGVVMSLTPLYSNVQSVSRQACLSSNGVLEIQDKVTPNSQVKYSFTAPISKTTTATVNDSKSITLSRNGKSVVLTISPSDESLAVTPVSRRIKADNNYESADAAAVDFECAIPAGKTTVFTIRITPVNN